MSFKLHLLQVSSELQNSTVAPPGHHKSAPPWLAIEAKMYSISFKGNQIIVPLDRGILNLFLFEQNMKEI